jgi:hypothetical protein
MQTNFNLRIALSYASPGTGLAAIENRIIANLGRPESYLTQRNGQLHLSALRYSRTPTTEPETIASWPRAVLAQAGTTRNAASAPRIFGELRGISVLFHAPSFIHGAHHHRVMIILTPSLFNERIVISALIE